MKIRLLSDLHVEGYPFHYCNRGEDVLVLAGDIHTLNQHRTVLNQIPSNVKVVMVPGNHEYYDGNIQEVDLFLHELQYEYENFFFLNNTSYQIDGVEFFGGAMRTDMELYGIHEKWFAEQHAKNGIADFHLCKKYNADGFIVPWTVTDHIKAHDKFCYELDGWINQTEGKRRVVVSHFVPSRKCMDPRFQGSMLNPYFICDMERFMGWEGLWLFGHTHSSWDVNVGDTRLVCNPRGYGDENQNGYNDSLILEI